MRSPDTNHASDLLFVNGNAAWYFWRSGFLEIPRTSQQDGCFSLVVSREGKRFSTRTPSRGRSAPPINGGLRTQRFSLIFGSRFFSALSGPMRDNPPYRVIPRRHSIAEGGIAPVCLVFMWYRASIAEIPQLGGVSHLHFACSPRGKSSEKGEGGIAPNWSR